MSKILRKLSQRPFSCKLENAALGSLAGPQSRNFWFSKRFPVKENPPYEIVKPARVTHRMYDVPKGILVPDYVDNNGEPKPKSILVKLLTAEETDRLRQSCQVARRILNLTGGIIEPGITTEEIDQFVADQAFKHGAYPSPLTYKGFPKAVCTSVNNVVCHGIPDDRPLSDGDIINVDITVFYMGMHGDTSKTFVVGEKVDAAGRYLIEKAEESLYKGIEVCQPGALISDIGEAIQNFIENECEGLNVVPGAAGHGIGEQFHAPPSVVHCQNNVHVEMEEGMAFTIEPVVSDGSPDCVILEDDGWTAISPDNSRSAQFEHTIVITRDGYEILTSD